MAFYLAQLQGAQTRYSATELAALAVVKSIKQFNHILWGRNFYVVTDHKALTSFMSSKKLNKAGCYTCNNTILILYIIQERSS